MQNKPADVISDADEITSDSPSSPLSPIEEDGGIFLLIGGLLMLTLVFALLSHLCCTPRCSYYHILFTFSFFGYIRIGSLLGQFRNGNLLLSFPIPSNAFEIDLLHNCIVIKKKRKGNNELQHMIMF